MTTRIRVNGINVGRQVDIASEAHNRLVKDSCIYFGEQFHLQGLVEIEFLASNNMLHIRAPERYMVSVISRRT
ncbi:uncharacterized protein PHALS_08355 [Plasmopara halstedii]|uniref:Uncharacterized protein n=1 Tax=Plasmopara halstedii TaxID=4781 RepID=A0A0P1ABY9_PLAHL|nr:uncharacterized protein PHALS_08355 [Plasmopara halstedii]CEG38272.1 hypothetical protein PHALS_08355 [Plasmopara halstedii]|eukprot:XP_024574641.1 hypothetical protein PHALS_08355 [Plasmopara halstedii]